MGDLTVLSRANLADFSEKRDIVYRRGFYRNLIVAALIRQIYVFNLEFGNILTKTRIKYQLMDTPLGKYLDKLKSNKSKISRVTGISTDRINALCHEETAILYADELYPIVYVSNHEAGLNEESFNESIDEIFPGREPINLLENLKDASPAGRLFGTYTQPRKRVETKLGMPNGKISKYLSDKEKRATAEEVIRFSDGMKMNLLEVFKEYYWVIVLDGETEKPTED